MDIIFVFTFISIYFICGFVIVAGNYIVNAGSGETLRSDVTLRDFFKSLDNRNAIIFTVFSVALWPILAVAVYFRGLGALGQLGIETYIKLTKKIFPKKTKKK